MKYNLTDSQKELLRWLVQQIRDSRLAEEFYVLWAQQRGEICDFPGDHPEITRGMLDALADAGLILCDANQKTVTSSSGKSHPRITSRETEIGRRCTVTGQAYEAVDSDFESSDEAGTRVTIGAIIHNMSGELFKRLVLLKMLRSHRSSMIRICCAPLLEL